MEAMTQTVLSKGAFSFEKKERRKKITHGDKLKGAPGPMPAAAGGDPTPLVQTIQSALCKCYEEIPPNLIDLLQTA